MSNDNSKTENIIAPAIGRGLSAIAQRRTAQVSAKSIQSAQINTEVQTAVTSCAHTCACAM